MLRAIAVLCLFLLVSPCFAQQRHVDLDNLGLQLLRLRGQAMARSGQHWIVDLSDRPRSRANLLAVRQTLLLEQRTFQEDIRFANMTNAETGRPYAEHQVVIDRNGEPRVVSLPWRYVYDPDNPNAIKRGSKKGYVAVSTIDVAREQSQVAEVARDLREVDGLLQLLER